MQELEFIVIVIEAFLDDAEAKEVLQQYKADMYRIDEEWGRLADAIDLIINGQRDLVLLEKQGPLQAQILDIILKGIDDLDTLKELLPPVLFHKLKFTKEFRDNTTGVLKQCDAKFGKIPRHFNYSDETYLKIHSSEVLVYSNLKPFSELCQKQDILVQKGKIVWAYIVQANELLFKPDRDIFHPAAVIYSLDKIDNPLILAKLAHSLFDLKGKKVDDEELQYFADKLADEYSMKLRLPIPTKFTGGIKCYYSSIIVQRDHLPDGFLLNSLFPLIVYPEITPASMILPSKYWPKQFIESMWMKQKKKTIKKTKNKTIWKYVNKLFTGIIIIFIIVIFAVPLYKHIVHEEPKENLLRDTFCHNVTEIPNFECKTLVNFYIQTNGSDWEDASYNNWTIKNTPCQWLGITCRRGRVIGIKRNFQKLAGIIPNLSSLTHLEELDLSYNKLSSHVSNLITLTYLKKLNLSNNNLSGNIPNLSVLEHLKWFDMSNNEFNISFFNNFCQKVTSISNSQCQALILFYNNTNGKEWTDTPENLWGLTNMPCEWKGITCRDGNIISIERNSKELKGFIHNLDGLSYLEEIDLYRNSITLKFPIANNLCKDVKKSICQNLVEMYIALIVTQVATNKLK